MSRDQIETYLLFLALISIGIFMRFYNLNWDDGFLFHPDERNIANAVTKIHFFSSLNPQFFAYGGFSIYLYRFVGDLLVFLTKDPSWVSDWGKINLIGRTFSALFSSLTCIPLFFLTKKLFKTTTALFATIFFAFTVSSIQLAHYATTESLLTGEGILLVLLAIYLFEKLRFHLTIFAGIVFGISLATKTSAILFGFPLFLAYIFFGMKEKKMIMPIIHLALFATVSFGCFFLFSPYTFLDSTHFLESMQYESGVATGTLAVPYTLQFNGTIPYVFQVIQFFWQIGLLNIFGVAGTFYLVWKIISNIKQKTKNIKYIISTFLFLVFPLVYFFYIGSWHTKFLRYMLPFLPFFIIIGSYMLVSIYQRYQKIGTALICIILTTTLLWALAFFSIYTHPQTRIVASEWIYAHIPPESKTLTEHWDDGLPLNLPGFSPSIYLHTTMTIYDQDNDAKLAYYGQTLSQGDYIIINSRRLYGTLIHLTHEYPLTSKYYKALFAGRLGYKKVAQFTSYPRLGPFIINDDSSEETFQVYEHPKVLVFQNTGHLTAREISQVLSR